MPLPVTLGPGLATWGYRGTYAGVPVDAELIRNVAVLVTDLAGDPVERGGGAAERGVWGVQRAGGAVLWGTAGADDHGEQDAGVPAGGPIAGQIGITVAGGNVVVSAYQDWIEYQLSGQTTWTRAGGTTVQLDPPWPLP